MIIPNGDHAQFEIDHANTPKEERPDWPLPSFDARDWAKAFCKIIGEKEVAIDEALMTTWFANSLMRGYDEAMARRIQGGRCVHTWKSVQDGGDLICTRPAGHSGSHSTLQDT
jgi:hypothetical protein